MGVHLGEVGARIDGISVLVEVMDARLTEVVGDVRGDIRAVDKRALGPPNGLRARLIAFGGLREEEKESEKFMAIKFAFFSKLYYERISYRTAWHGMEE